MPKPTSAEMAEYVQENRALAAFRRAQADLYAHTAEEAAVGITVETPEYLRLNQAVIDAGRQLPEDLQHLNDSI
ncbi:hypothetical protein [Streptomyces sp. NPDC006610]|uniref:hypothetical protein n=1 Tax=Streptomyces sp. NPDC006610 TaxID=3154584 RepID=UPI00339E3704